MISAASGTVYFIVAKCDMYVVIGMSVFIELKLSSIYKSEK